MNPKQIMFMGFELATGLLVSLSFGGLWLGSNEAVLADSVTLFKHANILGVWAITIPNVNFVLVGLRSIMMLDFAFFRGSAEAIRFVLLLSVGFALMWGIFIVVIGVINGLFHR